MIIDMNVVQSLVIVGYEVTAALGNNPPERQSGIDNIEHSLHHHVSWHTGDRI
jgi:hypothetical protein